MMSLLICRRFPLEPRCRYAGMFSLRLKTYALLYMTIFMTLKGSALRSRRMEPFLAGFVEAARHFLEEKRGAVGEDYFVFAERIRQKRSETGRDRAVGDDDRSDAAEVP